MKKEEILQSLDEINSKLATLESAARNTSITIEQTIEIIPEGKDKNLMWDQIISLRGLRRILEDVQIEINYLWEEVAEEEDDKKEINIDGFCQN